MKKQTSLRLLLCAVSSLLDASAIKICLLALMISGTTLHATRPDSAPDPIKNFVAAAKDADQEMALLLPSVQKVREAAALVPIIQTARKLAANVQQAGNVMTKIQYDDFQQELANVETKLDSLLNPQKGNPNACQKGCHSGFGDGFGSSTGWNRFVCKLGCFKSGTR